MKSKNVFQRIHINSPVILGFTVISLAVLLISLLTKDAFGRFMGVRFTSFADPIMYLRMFTHSITHLTYSHYVGNILLILVVGPLVEERYGSKKLLFMILATAFITGLINVLFFRNVILFGASGIVFMLILLASFANVKEGTIPLTVLLVALLYIGNEIVTGITTQDSISQLSHIIGGVCGALFGFLFQNNKKL